MENVERRVWREARAGSGHQAITRQLSWVQAAEILGISPRHMRRVRRAVEEHGMEAVLDQRAGARGGGASRPPPSLLCRPKRDVYADFSVRHFYERVTEKHQVKVSYNWLRRMLQEAGVAAKEPARGKYRRRRERRPLVGMLVHLDASIHQWIAGPPTQDLCPRSVGIWLPAEDSRTSISGFRAWRPADWTRWQHSSLPLYFTKARRANGSPPASHAGFQPCLRTKALRASADRGLAS
jgi:transposase